MAWVTRILAASRRRKACGIKVQDSLPIPFSGITQINPHPCFPEWGGRGIEMREAEIRSVLLVFTLGILTLTSLPVVDAFERNLNQIPGQPLGAVKPGGSSVTSSGPTPNDLGRQSLGPTRPVPSPIGYVSQTLVVNNRTLHSGNFLPPTCPTYTDAVVVPPYDQVYVTCQPDGLIVLNASSGVSVALLPMGSAPQGLAYDYSTDRAYV